MLVNKPESKLKFWKLTNISENDIKMNPGYDPVFGLENTVMNIRILKDAGNILTN